MKKILLSLSVLCGIAATAQTLNQGNHSYVAGDVYSTIPCTTVGITPGSTGAGATWNYSSATTNTAAMVNYAASTNTNTGYPSADVLVNGGAGNTSYYKSSTTDLKYYGGDMTINGTTVTLVYSNAAVYAVYPMSLSSSNNGAISGSAVVLGNPATFSGQCNILADATGTLTLPSGLTYSNTIRIVTSQTITTSALPFVGVATITMQNYDYYDPSTALAFKAPLFSISNSTLSSGAGTSAQTFVNVLKDNNVGINEKTKNVTEVSVFPNPATSVVNFNTSSKDAAKVIVYDVTGKVIATQVLENGKAQLNISTLTAGIYVYTVIGNNNEVLTKDKFNISK